MAVGAHIASYVVDFLLWREVDRRPATRADAVRAVLVLAIIATLIVAFVWWRNR